jgi:hypothetical protein
MFKILSTYIFKKIYIYKMQHLEGSGKPVLYIGRTVLKGERSMVLLWFRSAAACLLALRVRIPPGALTFVSCGCALSGRGFCAGPILVHRRPTECVCVIVYYQLQQ